MAQPLIIFGNGQMAELACARFRRDARYEVVGFTVDRSHALDTRFCELPLVPFDEVDRHFPAQSVHMFIGIGPVQANRIRAERFLQARQLGYRFASYISEQAIVDPEVVIGENCSIGESAIVAPFTRIGDNVRIGSASLIGHHCLVGDHCFIGVGSVVGGSVRIGARAFVGINATVRDRLTLGEGSVIGAGATIVRDTAPGAVFVAPEAVAIPLSAERVKL
jgi:sugar O-acyltransferase (sialic acid O-acetyltransferase NeuD family)